MLRFHIVRNLRSALWLLVFALIPLGMAALYWANRTGLPEDWRKAIEQEVSKHGAYVEIDSITYMPLRGFMAQNVRIFAEAERINEISRLERVQLILDNSRLARGEFRLRKVELRNARLALPVDPKNPSGESLHFSRLYGTILTSGTRLIEVRDARGEVGGVMVTLSAKLLGKDPNKRSSDDKNEGRRREMIARILDQMQHWDFGTDTPPSIRVDLSGDIYDKSSIKAEFQINAASVEKKQYRLRDVSAKGSLSGYLLNLTSFSARDGRGTLSGRADYQLLNSDGRFDIDSSIDLPRLLKSWLDTPVKIELLVGGKQQIQASGDFNLSIPDEPQIHLTGHGKCDSVMFRGVTFDSLDTWFSWQDGKLFLRDMKVTRPDGTAEGKVLIDGGKLRLSLHSTLPAPLYGPFFSGKVLGKVIADFSENEEPLTDIFLEGTFNKEAQPSWAVAGHGTLKNLSYKGVPLKFAECKFNLSPDELDFHGGTLTFDYTDYALRRAHGGPPKGTASVGRIRYDAKDKTIGVEAVKGDVWAAPLVRLFSTKIADDLEKYRFHTPPSLSGSGVVDITPQGRTDLTVTFSSSGLANYEFLGEDLTLGDPEGKVAIRGGEVRVSDLSVEAFEGDVSGSFLHSGKSILSGDLSWSKLAMPGLSSTYGFQMKGGGLFTGRIEFSMAGGDISTMEGNGLVALDKAELFSVPIFGPLSKVVSKAVDNERAGFQSAKSAFCTFDIHDGVLRTSDFQTATKSVTFTGDGEVDLSEKTIDFTIRLNARGFLGLITLPLRPFYGLFQFRGTGPIKKTVWENVHFTSPPDVQNEVLLKAPPRALVVPE